MTNLEAIKAIVGYPLSDNAYKKVLLDRDLTDSATYVSSTDKEAMDLAQASAIYIVCTQANKTEGGYSISITDKVSLLKIANDIYIRYGYSIPNSPTATFVNIM